MDPNPDTTVLHDEAYQAIDSVTVLGVVRLAVHAIVGAGGVFDETADDNAVAQGDTLCEILNLPYIHNGAGWIRAQGGTDNVAAGTANQGAFVAGIARAALAAYADGDVALPTFDLAGRLMVNMGGIAVETDDDSVAAGADHETMIPLNYGYDGTNWRRFQVRAASTDAGYTDTLMGLLVNARVCNWNPSTSAWERGTVLRWDSYEDQSNTYQALLTGSLTLGRNSFSGDLQIIESRANTTAQAYTLNRLLTDSVVRGDDGSTWSAVAARNFDAAADVAEALIGLLTNSRMAIYGRGAAAWNAAYGDAPSVVSGVLASAMSALYCNAITVGIDNTGAAVLRPVEARNYDTDADVAGTLIGLIVNSRLSAKLSGAGDWNRLYCDSASTFNGVGIGSAIGLYTMSVTGGVDSTGAAVLRPVEARALSGYTGLANSVIGLTTASYTMGLRAGATQPISAELPSGVIGVAANGVVGLYANAITVGLDNTGAAVLRPVEARDFIDDADVTQALIGLTTNSRLSIFDTAGTWGRWVGDIPSNISGRTLATFTTSPFAYTASVNVGIDNTGAAVLRPVEARDANAGADITKTLIGLLTQARCGVYDVSSDDWRFWWGDAVASISGRSTASLVAGYTGAINLGLDNTGAAVLRPVEARNYDARNDATAGLIGILANTRPSIYDALDADWRYHTGVHAVSPALTDSEAEYGSFVYQARADEFAAARRGKRFYGTHQTPGTLITAQTSFVATTPTLMYRINSASIRAIIRSLNISVQNTPGGVVYVTVAIDTADRYDSGGTAVTLQNSNEESATTAVGLHYFNPTANAAGAGTRYLGTWILPASAAANASLDFGDGILLGPTASTLLVYVWAATTAPDITHVLDLEEVA